MKITRKNLHKIIKEEVATVLEQGPFAPYGPTRANAEYEDAIEQHYGTKPEVGTEMGGESGNIPFDTTTVLKILKLARADIAKRDFNNKPKARNVPLDAVIDFLQDPNSDDEGRDHIGNAFSDQPVMIPPAERTNSAQMIKTILTNLDSLNGTEMGDVVEGFPENKLLRAMATIKKNILQARRLEKAKQRRALPR